LNEERAFVHLIPLLRVAALLTGTVGLLSGCNHAGRTVSEYHGWPYPGGDLNNTHYIKTVFDDSFTVHPTGITESGFPAEEIGLCLAGDIRGTKDPEIVMVGEDRIAVFDSGGKQLLLKELPEYCAADGLLYDIDDDGKQEIILGSQAAPRPELFALNGFGETVLLRQLDESAMDFSAMYPRAVHTGRLIVRCYPGSQRSPRGLLFLDPGTFRPLFMSMINSLPADLCFIPQSDDRESIIVSQETYDQGIFKELGRRGVFRTPNDTELHLITLDTDGYLTTVEVLEAAGETLGGRGTFHPIGPVGSNTLLMVRTPRRQEGDVFDPSIHIIDSAGSTILHSREFPGRQITAYRVLPDSTILLVCTRPDYAEGNESSRNFLLYVLDSTLSAVHTRPLEVGEIVLGPTFPLASERDRFGVLLWEDSRLSMQTTAPPYSVTVLAQSETLPKTILFLREAQSPDGSIVCIGEKMEIFRISKMETATAAEK
jgi:hypothetical protein